MDKGIALDRLAVIAFDKAEQEIINLCGLEGKDAELSCGRAKGPRFVSKAALGPPGSDCPKCTPVTAAWMCIATWLRHVVCWWDHRHQDGNLGSKVRAAWTQALTHPGMAQGRPGC